jgi:DMSO/TMAO reductase YedYZ molybdopterin-dependent catalytic subunit
VTGGDPRGPEPTLRGGPAVTGIEALAGGGAAALAAGLAMLLLRTTMGVRSIPERLMEWLLLFVPPGAFEAVLQRFGFDAKRYALAGAAGIALLVLAALGYGTLRRLPAAAIPVVGVSFWLIVMLVIMPLTAAGPFARDLLDGKRAAILGYLAVGLSYAAVLAVARLAARARRPAPGSVVAAGGHGRPTPARPRPPETMERRTVVGLLGSAGVMYLAAYVAVRLPKAAAVPSVSILDPQEPVPSGGIDPPGPHPQAAATPLTASTVPTPAPAPTAAAGPLEPAPMRQIERDKDGAVLPSGRTPGELATPITSNVAFYIVTKNAAGDPTLHGQDWRLLVDGEVQRPFQLDYTTLLKLPPVELTKTLECISNFVGKPELAPFGAELISTARWKGARVGDILQLTGGAKPGAEWLAVLSADEYTSSLPMEVANDPATLLVYEMNGEVLPREHGYPARLLVPDRYGMKSAKWVIGLRPMRREFLDWYGLRNWSKQGLVRTMCRIDVPAAGATLRAGTNVVAGIAYAGRRGIRGVEYSPDGGKTWHQADILDPAAGQDSWTRWRGQFELAAGASVRLVARATDGSGAVQVEPFSLPEPDGGTGWPSIEVRAE